MKKSPTIKIHGSRFVVRNMWWKVDGSGIESVSYYKDAAMTELDHAWCMDYPELDSMVILPKQSMVLKGENMAGDPEYKERLRVFSQEINPKEKEALVSWAQKNQKGGKDL